MSADEQLQGGASDGERYSRLAPLHIDAEMGLALLARQFFGPAFQVTVQKRPPGQPITPASGKEFLEYLKETKFVLDEPDRYLHQIQGLLNRMVENGLLLDMGFGADSGFVLLPKSYYALSELSELRSHGFLWLAKTLGGRFVHHHVSSAIVHVVGENDEGDERAGSGIICDAHHVLTCEHVVAGMKVAKEQVFQGRIVTVEKIVVHETEDVAVIRVDKPLKPVPGLGFLTPMVSQKVYRFGYSRIPCSIPSRTGLSPLVMQSGEVTNESVFVFGSRERFLYSAISRPGDSGGAVVSDDGYIVGMTTELSDARVGTMEGEELFSPHYAGIPSHVLAKTVEDMRLGFEIPFETYE